MIDVTSDEFKQTVRGRFFSNNLIRAGIVQVVDQPLITELKGKRYQSWSYDRLDEMDRVSTKAAADRVGDYITRHLTNFFSSIIVGVAGSHPLPEDKAERDTYRLAQVELFKAASKENDHPIALIPSFLLSQLKKQSLVSYHLCPFTKRSIPSYEGKQLVHDDTCVQPYLFYPGELKVFFPVPDEEVKVYSGDPSGFIYFWNHDATVKGFDYTGTANPANNYIDNQDSWKRTAEKSRIVRVG